MRLTVWITIEVCVVADASPTDVAVGLAEELTTMADATIAAMNTVRARAIVLKVAN